MTSLKGHHEPVHGLSYEPNGRYLLSASQDKTGNFFVLNLLFSFKFFSLPQLDYGIPGLTLLVLFMKVIPIQFGMSPLGNDHIC